MQVPRQGISQHGRVNQKRRTRASIVAAAKALLDEGTTPTVAEAAEAALVSRTTAYRYFPTQESLLVEIAMDVDVDDIEELVAHPEAQEPNEHALAVIDAMNDHVFAAETQYRTALRLYLDMWLTAAAAGDTEPVVREGRRRRWLEQTLAPLRPTVSAAAWERLVAALCLLMGGEAMVVFRDVCGLDAENARRVVQWVGETLIRETVGSKQE